MNESKLESQQEENGAIRLTLHGRVDSTSVGHLWRETSLLLKDPSDLILDLHDINYIDISGVGYLLDLRRRQAGGNRDLEIRGLKQDLARLVEMFDPAELIPSAPPETERVSVAESVGRSTLDALVEARSMVTFLGEVTVSLYQIVRRKVRLRWSDTFLVAESAGVNALPVICMMGLILGLIMAFQGAIPLRRFGGEVLVADMLILAMFREMGPLFTAIILAARSSSAFAAELGTMKINEEIDALTTMGLDPVPFLAIPRILAGVLVAPALTVFMNFMGLLGGGFVFVSMGFTPVTYLQRLLLRGSAVDFSSGLFRSLVFGAIIAGIGCMQGLRTGRGARAVGESTTSAVVASIVAIIIADGLLAVLFFRLGV